MTDDGAPNVAVRHRSQQLAVRIHDKRDPRATLLVESGLAYAELKSAILYCHAEIITDADEIAANMALVRADGALTASMSQTMSEQVRASMAKRVALRFTPFGNVTWDHAKLGGFY